MHLLLILSRQTIIVFLLLCNFTSVGQNLILNPGFEDHSTFSAYARPHEFNFNYLKKWKVIGLEVCDYCHAELEEKKVKGYRTCANSVEPHGGNGMVKMLYVESCPELERITGCASYLQTEIQTPLAVGNIYEISFWVYFPYLPSIDTGILTNIGFYPSLYPDRLDVHELFKTEYFFADKIEYDKWFQIKKYVRALCPLKWLTVGPFKDENFPVLHRPLDVISVYYIDNVSISPINEDDVAAHIQVTPFCNYYDKRKQSDIISTHSDFDINFSLNNFLLSASQLKELDSVLRDVTIDHSSVILLSGHTDSTGSENMALSHNRVEAVKAYLIKKYNLGEQNFICFPMGSIVPKGNNMTGEGRASNRRVSVRLTNLKPSAVIYRRALNYLNTNDISLSAREFSKWISLVRQEDKIKLLFDDRLKKLKNSPAWQYLIGEVRNSYSSFRSKSQAFFLDSLYFEDQKYRTYNPYLLTGFFPEFEAQSHIARPKELLDYNYSDSINLESAKRYLAKNEFPGISEVGRRAVRGITYTIIHSQDSVVMKTYLPVIFEHCNLGEAEWEWYAMLTDKLQIQRNLPQLYGTQKEVSQSFLSSDNLYPIDNIDSVNVRRVKIGLDPIPNK